MRMSVVVGSIMFLSCQSLCVCVLGRYVDVVEGEEGYDPCKSAIVKMQSQVNLSLQ